MLVGFVNVTSDGGDHAFLIDTKTRGAFQRRQVGTRVVAFGAQHAKAQGANGCTSTSMHDLRRFYFDACGFQPTDAGLIDLRSLAV